MYLYNVAFFAMTVTEINYGAVLIWADTIQEAKGHGLEYITNKNKPEMGWFNHAVQAYQVDYGVIVRAYNQLNII